MTADRRHDDNATRIAHKIEARLHHGEQPHSVLHDELHKLQKLDSHHGVIRHDKFQQDVHKVEHKLHQDGYLPNLHIRVDQQNHIHLDKKKHGDHAHGSHSDHAHGSHSSHGDHARGLQSSQGDHARGLQSSHGEHAHGLQSSHGEHAHASHRPGEHNHSEHPRGSLINGDPTHSRQRGQQGPSLDVPPVQYPQQQNYRAPIQGPERSLPPAGDQNFAPPQYRDPRYRPDAVPYVPPPIYTNPNLDQAPLRSPGADLRPPDFTPYRGPTQDVTPYRGPTQDVTPYRGPTQDVTPYRGPTQDITPYRDPRYRQPGPSENSFEGQNSGRLDDRFRRPDRDFYPSTTDGSFRELRLDNRVSNHGGADALVYVRKDFDPSKPVHLAVYNHGFGSTVSSALDKNQIKEMMSHAQPNTVLVLPEWQSSPGSRSGNSGTFGQQGKFTAMVQEMMQKTPALQGATLANVDRIDIIAHSAGYSPTEKEIYKNPALASRVHSITLLDSLYDRNGFDQWLRNNIADLSAGRKQFYNFSNGSTASNSRAQANFVESLLRSNGLPYQNYAIDYRGGNDQVARQSAKMAQHSILFATTSVRHLDIPRKYIGATLEALNPERQMPIPYA